MTKAKSWIAAVSATAIFSAHSAAAQTEIEALIAALGDRTTEWQAAAELQARGEPAIAALIGNLRIDGYLPNLYGNHSPTMRALEKIGAPAAAAIEQTLTPQLLRSGNLNEEDRRLIETVTLVLTEIGSPDAVPALLRIALTAENPAHRDLAFDGLVWPAFDLDIPFWPLDFEPVTRVLPEWSWSIGTHRWRATEWDACLGRASDFACPFDPVYVEGPRAGVAMQPFLADVLAHLERETESRVRLAAARVLAAWGSGSARRAGERS